MPPDSSTLDHPSQRARTIDADHREMVKFHGKNDKNYEMVRDDIKELIIKAEEKPNKLSFTTSIVAKNNVEQTSQYSQLSKSIERTLTQ